MIRHLVIVGPTASGKSSLAMRIAKEVGGEIISADSRAVYKRMDIGTAKPSFKDRAEIPHHCLDLVYPDEPFTVADYKIHANGSLFNILGRHKLPILVGGSGLYVDSVIFDYEFAGAVDPGLRAELDYKSIGELQAIIDRLGYQMPENKNNKRYLIRTIERQGVIGGRSESMADMTIVGIDPGPAKIESRIQKRVGKMIEDGLIDECERLMARFPLDCKGFKAPAYKAFLPYLTGEYSLELAIKKFISNDRKLAKRQMTWFRRNGNINWFSSTDEAYEYIMTLLKR